MVAEPTPKPPTVVIIDGTFRGFEGIVTGIDQANNTVEVTFSFFGKKKIKATLDVRLVRRTDFRI